MSERRSKLVVIALGGNAIISSGQRGTIAEQFENSRESLKGVVKCIQNGFDVVITHGNGPQVGDALIRAEMASNVVPLNPLGICVAETEGTMGYMLQQTLMNALKSANQDNPVVALVTQVLVDPSDDAFDNPTKPIGPSYEEWEAIKFRNERDWKLTENSHGEYRRVVASPVPLEIIDADVIKHLVDIGMVVIAAGGGGIPVRRNEDGKLEGVDAVIDKDFASAILAREVGASTLLMATAVEGVYLNFDTPGQELLSELKAEDARRYLEVGHFPLGSMAPKIESALNFLEEGGAKAIICSVDDIANALEGKSGTSITL